MQRKLPIEPKPDENISYIYTPHFSKSMQCWSAVRCNETQYLLGVVGNIFDECNVIFDVPGFGAKSGWNSAQSSSFLTITFMQIAYVKKLV
jgi:hypothetical protein